MWPESNGEYNYNHLRWKTTNSTESHTVSMCPNLRNLHTHPLMKSPYPGLGDRTLAINLNKKLSGFKIYTTHRSGIYLFDPAVGTINTKPEADAGEGWYKTVGTKLTELVVEYMGENGK